METTAEQRSVVVAGAGPAGLTCAIYLARAGFRTTVCTNEEATVSALATTSAIENYPGFPHGVDPVALLGLMAEQAESCGAEFRTEGVSGIDAAARTATLTDGSSLRADAFVVAVGAEPVPFSCPGSDLVGIHTCAVCDGSLYAGQEVAVIGGGDTAFGDALYLSGVCSSVTMLVRRDVARVSNEAVIRRVREKENVRILWKTVVSSIGHEPGGSISLELNGGPDSLEVDGLFACVGVRPRAVPVAGDPSGVVWLCGDCRPSATRQVSCAVGDAARTALEVISAIR